MELSEHLKIIGENITKARKAKGISSQELGYLCDMEKSNIIPIEKGRINVTIATLKRIGDALGVDFKDLLS